MTHARPTNTHWHVLCVGASICL